MYPIRFSLDIQAPVARVWRALCDPSAVVQWDSGGAQALDAPLDYPRPGHHVRWRLRSGIFRLLHDRPIEVVPEKKLHSRLRLGPYEIDETYSLTETLDGTRIDLTAGLRARIPLLAALVERAHGGPQTRGGFAASLRGLKRYCEHQTS